MAFKNYLNEQFSENDYRKIGLWIDLDTREDKNTNRVIEFANLMWRFYANIIRYTDSQKLNNPPVINLPDFYNMVFVEAMHELMPQDFKSSCKGVRARESLKKELGETYDKQSLPGLKSRLHNDCYEQGVQKRNQEFLVNNTRAMPERPWFTYGREYFGKCEDEENCACKIEKEDTPDPSKLFEWNLEKMVQQFPGLSKNDYRWFFKIGQKTQF